MATSTPTKPKKPAKPKIAWDTSVLPDVTGKNYKTWAIAMTAAIAVLTVAIIVLVVALVIMAGDARKDTELQQVNNDTTAVDSDPEKNASPSTGVDVSSLDGSKLLTATNVGDEEIPDHYIGNKDAKVVVIEYEDFACSHCQALAADAEQIHADYQDRVLFIHRSFNLSFPNSERTLRAAEAAYQLSGEKAYWAMFKLLYQDTKWTGEEPFGAQKIANGYAKQIGLDINQFEKAMANTATSNKITRDRDLGAAAGVAGTPTWIINGQQVTPLDSDIRTALDAAL